jgi:hypothetical protein
MDYKQFETRGYYEPGFLHLRVNTDEELIDLNKFAADPATAAYFSTFLHEYVHFLQDVTTINGLANTIHYIDMIQEVNYEVIHSGRADFKVPFAFSNANNIQANKQLRNIYAGYQKPIDYIKYDSYQVLHQVVKDKEGNEHYPEIYKVHYYTRSGIKLSFNFGWICLTEYVAHAIQNKFVPGTDHSDVPYVAPELIIHKEYPEFGSDTMMIAALCDASLMSYHPAQVFFKTIQQMKADKFIPATPKEVYDYAYASISFRNGTGAVSTSVLYEQTAERADRQLADALKSDIFAPNLRWVKHVFASAKKLRLENPSFITDLVNSPGQLSETFYAVFGKLGTPFFTNKNYSGGFVPPKNLSHEGIQPYQLLVFKEIIDVFHGKRHCGLYQFCKQRPDRDITNHNCLTAPWKRGVEEDLCPFGQFWKTWGLNGHFPEY